MKTLFFSETPEQFRKKFQNKIARGSFLSRLTPEDTDRLYGVSRADRFFLYRKKKFRFCLAPVTARGAIERKDGKSVFSLRFSRPAAVTLVGSALFLLFFITFLLCLTEDLVLASIAAILTLATFLFLFCLPKKEKRFLENTLRDLGLTEYIK